LAYETPLLLGISFDLPWMGIDIFWNYTLYGSYRME